MDILRSHCCRNCLSLLKPLLSALCFLTAIDLAMPRPSRAKLHPHIAHVGIDRSLNTMTINFQKNYTGSAVQTFRIPPKNVQTIQGRVALMDCVVDGAVGGVQWSKDGIMLGYDRRIPGYIRYSMIGEQDTGHYNLMIKDVQLSDDGRYECQVSPRPGNPALQSAANLTVLIPPDNPQIEGYSNGSVVEIPHTQQIVELTCHARNARPAAIIEWFRDDEEITTGKEYTTEDLGNKLINAKSVLTIRPQFRFEHNNAIYTCQARNDAILDEAPGTSVELSIQYPPEPPEISGYTPGQVIKAGETLHLSCVSRGGNPLAQVTWFKNNEEVDFSYTTVANRAINEMVFQVQPSDNNAQYRCEVSNVVTPRPLTRSVRLQVYFPPQSVNITGKTLAKVGEEIKLSCVSSNSNPAADITWISRGRQLTNVTTRSVSSPDGGYITYSNITVRLTEQQKSIIYSCQAINSELGKTALGEITLSVLYPPNPPVIKDYIEGQPVRAGTLQRMQCVATGGNPPATLKWFKGKKKLDSEIRKYNDMSIAEVAIVVKPDDNEETYKCQAKNAATRKPLEASIVMVVHFPPDSVNVTMDPENPHAGENVTLHCMSASSNPAATVVWIRNDRLLEGIDMGEMEGEYGGMRTMNKLEIVAIPVDHEAVYRCRATNQILDESVHDALTLDILFKPEFDLAFSPSVITIKEKESRVINYTVHANPRQANYSLLKDGVKLNLKNYAQLWLGAGLLNLTKVKKSNAGVYTLEARNVEGSTEMNITIDVQYKAVIKKVSPTVKADIGSTAFFECVAEANPLTADMVTWSRDDYDMSKTKQEYKDAKSHLTIVNVEKTDAGDFTCTAFNGIGVLVKRKAKLVVAFAPIIDKSPELAKSASDKGRTGKLKCRAEGEPSITFKWFKKGQEIRRSTKYTLSKRSEGKTWYVHTLSVKNVQTTDYGNYTCRASNTKGADNFYVLLDGTSKPDPPYSIRFVNASHVGITLTWMPGFNGGLPQSFRVRYRGRSVDHGYIHKDVVPHNATTYNVEGLEEDTEYELTVMAFNHLGESKYQTNIILARTSISPEMSRTPEDGEEVPLIIILVVCIVGLFLLALNVALILFFIRRRKKRLENGSDSTSQTNTIELYGPGKEVALYPFSPSEMDSRSYTSYDKTIDDFSDDLNKSYDDDDVKRVFLPPHDYTGRPYTPSSKQDSPHLSTQRKYPSQVTYVDSEPPRQSPWRQQQQQQQQQQEDPYRSMNSIRKGTSTFDPSYNDGGAVVYSSNHLRQRPGSYSRRSDTRPKSVEAGEFPPPRSGPAMKNGPVSMATSPTPPPPPVRSASRGAVDVLNPPVPARNYSPHDTSSLASQPRYAPPPGSLATITNPTYIGPSADSPEVRGHLV